MNFITIPSQMQKVTTKDDRILRCTFDTQEIPLEHSMQLLDLGLGKKYCIFGISEDENMRFEEIEVPSIPRSDKSKKTWSQKLREVIWLDWDMNVNKKKYPEFEQYYSVIMEGLCEKFKDRLN